jgi:hypothetical protein
MLWTATYGLELLDRPALERGATMAVEAML